MSKFLILNLYIQITQVKWILFRLRLGTTCTRNKDVYMKVRFLYELGSYASWLHSWTVIYVDSTRQSRFSFALKAECLAPYVKNLRVELRAPRDLVYIAYTWRDEFHGRRPKTAKPCAPKRCTVGIAMNCATNDRCGAWKRKGTRRGCTSVAAEWLGYSVHVCVPKE